MGQNEQSKREALYGRMVAAFERSRGANKDHAVFNIDPQDWKKGVYYFEGDTRRNVRVADVISDHAITRQIVVEDGTLPLVRAGEPPVILFTGKDEIVGAAIAGDAENTYIICPALDLVIGLKQKLAQDTQRKAVPEPRESPESEAPGLAPFPV